MINEKVNPVAEIIDPVERLTHFMKKKGWLDEEWIASVKEESAKEVDLAVEELEAYPPADPSVIFDYVFETPTWTIQEQKEKLLAHRRGE